VPAPVLWFFGKKALVWLVKEGIFYGFLIVGVIGASAWGWHSMEGTRRSTRGTHRVVDASPEELEVIQDEVQEGKLDAAEGVLRVGMSGSGMAGPSNGPVAIGVSEAITLGSYYAERTENALDDDDDDDDEVVVASGGEDPAVETPGSSGEDPSPEAVVEEPSTSTTTTAETTTTTAIDEPPPDPIAVAAGRYQLDAASMQRGLREISAGDDLAARLAAGFQSADGECDIDQFGTVGCVFRFVLYGPISEEVTGRLTSTVVLTPSDATPLSVVAGELAFEGTLLQRWLIEPDPVDIPPINQAGPPVPFRGRVDLGQGLLELALVDSEGQEQATLEFRR
jgi:hypothetical protein